MAIRFNPLTGNFDLTGSGGGGGGASYIDGEVAVYTDLPLDGTAAINTAWLVREASGAWLLARKPAGIYIRTATAGVSRDADYTYAGILPDVFNDANFLLYDNGDSSKNLAFQLSGITTGTTRTLTVPDASGTIALTSSLTETRIYTAGDTWTKPAGAKLVHYTVIGGGGGGGSGRVGAAGTDRGGGGGGSGAGITLGWINPSALGATETITVGSGGAGGASNTASTDTNGNIGTVGGQSSIGTVVIAVGGNAGQGGVGSGTANGGAGTGSSSMLYGTLTTLFAGGASPATSAAQSGVRGPAMPAGGGAGGRITSANTSGAGGSGGIVGSTTLGQVLGGAAVVASNNGLPGATAYNFVGSGGSGASTTSAGFKGGAGGDYGGGGAGGSGAENGAGGDNSGGTGGNGIVVITTYF
jgi:hypothetical protein